MSIDLLILKAVLLLRKAGNKYQTKEEQIEEQREWLWNGYTSRESLNEWIDELKREIAKTPEEQERESLELIDRLCEYDARELEREAREQERKERDADAYYSPSCPWNAPGMSVRDFI